MNVSGQSGGGTDECSQALAPVVCETEKGIPCLRVGTDHLGDAAQCEFDGVVARSQASQTMIEQLRSVAAAKL